MQVVEQQPYTRASASGVAQRPQEHAAGLVVLHQVVLDVEAACGTLRQVQPRMHRKGRSCQQAKAAEV